MKFSRWVLLVTAGAALLSSGAARAEEASALPKGFSATPVFKSGKSAEGDPLVYPQTQKPEIVSVVGTIEPKGQTPLHITLFRSLSISLKDSLQCKPKARNGAITRQAKPFLKLSTSGTKGSTTATNRPSY